MLEKKKLEVFAAFFTKDIKIKRRGKQSNEIFHFILIRRTLLCFVRKSNVKTEIRINV